MEKAPDSSAEQPQTRQDFLRGLEGWYTGEHTWWDEDAPKAGHEGTDFVGIRLEKDILAAADAHARACGVTRTMYFRNCVLTAMLHWSAELQGLMDFLSSLLSSPAVREAVDAFFKFVNSIDGSALEEVARLATTFDCQILGRKMGISTERVRNAVAKSLLDLVAEETLPAEEEELKLALESVQGDEEGVVCRIITIFWDLIKDPQSANFKIEELPGILDGYTGRDLDARQMTELITKLFERPAEVVQNALEGIERQASPWEEEAKLLWLSVWRRKAATCRIQIECHDADSERGRAQAAWRVRYRGPSDEDSSFEAEAHAIDTE